MNRSKAVIRFQVQWPAKFAQSQLVFTSAVPVAEVAGVLKTQEALKPNQAISTAPASLDLIAQSRLSTTKTATAAWSELSHWSVLYVRTDLQDHNDSASESCFDTTKLSYVRLQTWQEYTNL